ncbi:hypothetical protein JOD54_001051 [Actinokineospora baliensis]|uniref:hypothetical protein n=1 Tax=Actinokineospora baliensis TaxID=547056 RepID=UPI0019567242|nr:hypothetical protein [Actinokineospora baliensis]MBM7770847.1 hypothetical protein [Actinokineospora baliensis]
MLLIFLTSYLFAGLTTYRLVGVVVRSTSTNHRKDAIRLIGLIWSGSSLGPGVVLAVQRAHELVALF